MEKVDMKKISPMVIAEILGTTKTTVRATVLKHINDEVKRPTILMDKIIKMSERIVKAYEVENKEAV